MPCKLLIDKEMHRFAKNRIEREENVQWTFLVKVPDCRTGKNTIGRKPETSFL